MKLKGNYSSEASYSIGDVVIYDHVVYHLQKPQVPGATPKDTICWGRLNQMLAEAVMLMMDAVDIAVDAANDDAGEIAKAEVEKYFLNDETLILKAGDNSYAVTVDDSGETPELAVEAIVEEESDT